MAKNLVVVPGNQNHYHKTEVNIEHPDAADSARLYGELNDKVKEDLLAHVKVDNNVMNGRFEIAYNVEDYGYIIYYKFKLNGNVYDGKFELSAFELQDKKLQTIGEEAYKEILGKFTQAVMLEMQFEGLDMVTR